jgi:hypothetical protein
MIKISTVAIKSLKDLQNNLFHSDMNGKMYDLYCAYRSYRHQMGYREDIGFKMWTDRVLQYINDMIAGYEDDEKNGLTPSRCRTIESGNLMVMTHVTGGFDGDGYECEAHICITGGITGYYSGK